MKIIVLAGGLSTERDVSLSSAAGICRTLLEKGHDAFLLDVFMGLEHAPENLEDVFTLPDHGLDIVKNISTEEPDLAAVKASRPDQSDCFFGPNVIELCRLADITFLGLHGGEGENGKLQAAFDLLGIKYTGPDSLGCAVAMHKGVAKQIFLESGVDTPGGGTLYKNGSDLSYQSLGLTLPVVVKPCSGGSSIGVYIVNTDEEYQNALEEMSGEAVEYVRGIPVVKTFGQSVFSFKRFRDSIKKYEKWTISYTKDLRLPMMGYTVAINSVFAILIAAVYLLGGVKSGTADPEFLLNLLFYIIITPIITVTLTKMMYAGENTMVVEDALARIDNIIERKPLPQAAEEKSPEDVSIEFEHVSFRYDGAEKDALHDISLQIRPGEHIAFVGPSGGGKTTLARLVARFADASQGEIRIGGANVKEIHQKALMDMVSFVFQDSRLLKMSIYENVRMGKKNATREEVVKALKNAQCEDIIAKLPDGIDTVIGSKGTYLSGGEAQRISIARAMIKNAPILILDEATAFADPDNEAKVQAAFSRLSQGKTVIMIAHRLSSVIDADRIFVLRDGEICQSGTHKELEKADGLYAHMWKEYNQSVCWKVGA